MTDAKVKRRIKELMDEWATLRFALSEQDAAEAWAESMALHEAADEAGARSRPDSIDAAWAAVEAVLPEGWVLELASPSSHELRPTFRAEAWNGNGGVTRGYIKADDLTAAAALRALEARLAHPVEPEEKPDAE